MEGRRQTVNVKLVFAVSPAPSVTVSVIVVSPLYTETGVNVNEQFPLLSGPIIVRPTGLINAVLLATPVTVSRFATVWLSPTVKGNAEVDDPMLMSWLTMDEMVGGVMTVKSVTLVAVPPTVVTEILPVLAPDGTMTVR